MQAALRDLQRVMTAMPPSAPPFAVLRVGLDHFRGLNERLGTAAGDALLTMVMQRLQSGIREHEAVIRLPGDEFAVVLHSVSSVLRAGRAADRLHALAQEPYLFGGERVELCCCMGLALSPMDGCEAEHLLYRAGIALQHAKAAGSGVVQFFEPAMALSRKPMLSALTGSLLKGAA